MTRNRRTVLAAALAGLALPGSAFAEAYPSKAVTIVVPYAVGGWGSVARAQPDGYTLLTTEMSFTIAPGLIPTLPFDARKGFTQIATAMQAPHVLVVNPQVPAKTVQQFIALAKAQPGKMNYGSGGNGTNTHVGGELFKAQAGVVKAAGIKAD